MRLGEYPSDRGERAEACTDMVLTCENGVRLRQSGEWLRRPDTEVAHLVVRLVSARSRRASILRYARVDQGVVRLMLTFADLT
ncbi:hypothetical protein GCM10010430_21180 [Kitasatospora cystarginea]|uniref:Uncharacterized protein n=1 Tax=Kitasatospora cystarginea TaxID=58350 RepID=A0ABP5QLI4_9ACTN